MKGIELSNTGLPLYIYPKYRNTKNINQQLDKEFSVTCEIPILKLSSGCYTMLVDDTKRVRCRGFS